ncbi:MAG: DUF6090 family protein [Flavobacteriales bacterium]
MTRLFRQIRQGLLAKGRVTRYLTYAVGEILLVVIGIFLALQLNNWNAGRKEAAKEIGLLAEMRSNLEADLQDCRYNIGMNQRLLNGNVAVLKHLEDRTPFHDSLAGPLREPVREHGAHTQYIGLDNLKSIGFDLIRNDSLRRSITTLYSERYTYLNKVEQGFDSHLQPGRSGPHIYAKVVMDTVWKSGYPIDPVAHGRQPVQRRGAHERVHAGHMVRIYQGFEERILVLMEQIEGELTARR